MTPSGAPKRVEDSGVTRGGAPRNDLALFDLSGRRALVTGGAGGIGLGISEALAAAGASVAVLGRSDATERAAERVGGVAVRADLGDRDDLQRGFTAAVESLGGLDVLVTSHGNVHAGPTLETALADWDDTLEVNLTSVFELCRLAGALMVPRGSGKIVTIASMLSFQGGFRAAAYAASKGGVAQLTKALANEWAPHGVNVNAIAPCYVKTALNRHIWQDDPERSEAVLARLPAGRWGEPSDLAGAAVFLSSAASDYVHGIVLPVDGGWLGR
jgi:2-dehydro-3-deoxy-D-gluconate 5-dehydrogenase